MQSIASSAWNGLMSMQSGREQNLPPMALQALYPAQFVE